MDDTVDKALATIGATEFSMDALNTSYDETELKIAFRKAREKNIDG